MNGLQFFKHAFALDCRNFSEICAEPVITGMYGHLKSEDRAFDGTKLERHKTKRIEVKGTRIVSKPVKASYRPLIERAISFDQRKTQFTMNFNHLKPLHFDLMYYLLFFTDRIAVFCITSPQIFECRKLIQYQEKQGRDTIQNCDGQFPMTAKLLPIHLDRFFEQFVSYDEAASFCA